MATEHPARAASQRSMEIVQRKGENARSEWLALFADDAIVEDPIGPSPLDPQGKGHSGKQAIGAFWDMAIAPNQIRFDIQNSYACGNEVANVGTLTTTGQGGTAIVVDGVFIYKVDEEGKILSLRAFWEFEQVIARMQKT